jgi:hypothetical protein
MLESLLEGVGSLRRLVVALAGRLEVVDLSHQSAMAIPALDPEDSLIRMRTIQTHLVRPDSWVSKFKLVINAHTS